MAGWDPGAPIVGGRRYRPEPAPVARQAPKNASKQQKARIERQNEAATQRWETRFDRKLVKSVYDAMARYEFDHQWDVEKDKKDAKEKTRPDVNVRGKTTGNLNRFQPNGYYFDVTLDFAIGQQGNNWPNHPEFTEEEWNELDDTWGTGFGNPLVNPRRDCVFIVRATISQLRVDPLIGGFKLRWYWPSGWRHMDGEGATMLVEASSNPLVIMRKFISPDEQITNTNRFRCRVKAFFP